MPTNLDASTQRIIFLVTSFTTLVIAIPALWGQLVIIPNLRRKLPESSRHHRTSPSLFIGCVACVAIMMLASFIITLPIVSVSIKDDASGKEELILSSSINFCEQDFQHSPYIAEPANVMSSFACYVLLGLLGLVGPPSKEYRQSKRFLAIYSTLLTIGVGSMALHALLTAEAQGGDELPMLWYTATAAYCAMDIILYAKKQNSTSWLAVGVTASAVAATATYVVGREDFTIFYILFSLYSQAMIFSVLWIAFGLSWQEDGIQFKATLLLPVAAAAGWSTILAIWTWVSEMLYCNQAMQTGDAPPFFWNRVVHPLWHFLSGLLAWLLVQFLLAAHGMQRGWGVPTIQWFGAPYVAFQSISNEKKKE